MSFGNDSFIVLTVNHEIAPLEVRERFAIDAKKVSNLYEKLHLDPSISESLVLNTCNRFEIYTTLNNGTNKDFVIDLLSDFYGTSRSEIKRHLHFRYGQEAVQHLIEVSAGLRSQITGEAEIFGQVKHAYAESQNLGYAGKVINRVFQKGFQAAKLIRHSTSIGEGLISISSVAVDLASKIFGDLSNASVLSLGTGEIGEKTVKALQSRGSTEFGIASRSKERAAEVAKEWGGQPHLMEDLSMYLHEYDIVIASVGSEEAVLTESLVETAIGRRRGRPLFLIDLGLPRNIQKGCENLENVFLYNLDDLATIAEENLAQRKSAVEESQGIAAQKSVHIWDNIVKRGLGH